MNTEDKQMTDEQWTTYSGWLRLALKTKVLGVTFTKKDGTERVMRCTLDTNLIPKKEIKEGQEFKERKQSDTSIAVYDLDKKEWRSFVVKSVKTVDFTVV